MKVLCFYILFIFFNSMYVWKEARLNSSAVYLVTKNSQVNQEAKLNEIFDDQELGKNTSH